MTEVTAAKLAKIMERVRLLLARADHPNTPPAEAELSRERAERLMEQYRIEEDGLDDLTKARMGIKPTSVTWDLYPLNSEFRSEYQRLAYWVADHVGGAYKLTQYGTVDGVTWAQAKVYGFESDLAYAALLWNSIRLAFAARLEPSKVDADSDEDNVYRMRTAGMERARIALAMGWGGEGTNGPVKVTKVFKAACAARGEDPKVLTGKGNNVRTFRRSYAEAFVNEMWHRLYALRNARGLNSTGLVMANRAEQIDELFYAEHPEFRPKPVDPNAPRPKPSRRRLAKPKEQPVNYAAAARGREAAQSVDIGAVGGNRLAGQ